MSQLTAGRVIVYKNRSVQERGDPRIIPPIKNRTSFCGETIVVYIYLFPDAYLAGLPFGGNTDSPSV